MVEWLPLHGQLCIPMNSDNRVFAEWWHCRSVSPFQQVKAAEYVNKPGSKHGRMAYVAWRYFLHG